VHTDLVLGTEIKSLSRHLGKPMKDELPDLSDWEGLLLSVGSGDIQGFPRSAHTCGVVDHVHGLPVGVRWKQANRLPMGVACQSLLLRQAHRGQGTSEAQPLVPGHGRTLDGCAKLPGPGNTLPDLLSGCLVYGNVDRDITRVIPDTGLFHRSARVLFQQESIRRGLQAVVVPSLWPVLPPSRMSSLVLVGNELPVPLAKAIDLSHHPQCAAFQ
jgi:hypothetical protein